LTPSADKATQTKEIAGTVLEFQVAPPFGEMKTARPPKAAASVKPSADELIEYQFRLGMLLMLHVAPELVEV
jgi:hypothetical protein